MFPATTDVLIVGAGPTGLTLAISLVARGRQVAIVDRLAEGQNTSRASVVYSRTLEVLDPYGVARRLVSRGIRAPRFTIRDRDRVLMRVRFDRLPTAFPFTLLVSQAVTEELLLRRPSELGGRVLRPLELAGVVQDDREVVGGFAGGERVRARYPLGADGMHSTVREQAGIEFPTGGSGDSYSLADVHLSGGVPRDEVAVYFSPAGQLVSVPLPDGTHKLVASVADAPHEPDVAFLQDKLDTRGPRAERAVVRDVVWGSRFRIHHAVADRYRAASCSPATPPTTTAPSAGRG